MNKLATEKEKTLSANKALAHSKLPERLKECIFMNSLKYLTAIIVLLTLIMSGCNQATTPIETFSEIESKEPIVSSQNKQNKPFTTDGMDSIEIAGADIQIGKEVKMTVEINDGYVLDFLIARDNPNGTKIYVISNAVAINLSNYLESAIFDDFGEAISGYTYQLACYDFDNDGTKEIVAACGDMADIFSFKIFKMDVTNPNDFVSLCGSIDEGSYAFIDSDNNIRVIDMQGNENIYEFSELTAAIYDGEVYDTEGTQDADGKDTELEQYLNLIQPLYSGDIMRKIATTDGFMGAITGSFTGNDKSNSLQKANTIYNEVSDILTPIINYEAKQGDGLQRTCKEISNASALLLKQLKYTLDLANDNDLAALQNLSFNFDCDTKARAAKVQIDNMVIKQKNEEIRDKIALDTEAVISREQAADIVLRYVTQSSEPDPSLLEQINLISDSSIVFGEKHYCFSVEDSAAIYYVSVSHGGLVEEVGNSKHTIDDSKIPAGKNNIIMPDLVGMQLAEAESVLTGMGIKYQVAYYKDSKPKGTVISLYPSAGNALQNDREAAIHVSMGE